MDLDTWLHGRYPPEHDDDRGWPAQIRDWVRHTLVALYDRSDPDEAAEQTLFALSGQIRTLPRAAF